MLAFDVLQQTYDSRYGWHGKLGDTFRRNRPLHREPGTVADGAMLLHLYDLAKVG